MLELLSLCFTVALKLAFRLWLAVSTHISGCRDWHIQTVTAD